jgi:predicted SAM-dependent methyltransferase
MLDFLGECRRILKPGGVFSVAVPNARIFIDAYMNPDEFDKEKYCSWNVGLSYTCSIDYVNFIAYLGGEHKHLFDVENLASVIEEAGFRNVRIREFDPDLDLKERKHESIYAAATK